MTTHASQTSSGETKQILEEKLNQHIQREFDLGEKVISLLKQKNELEVRLQEQLSSKGNLEERLSEAISSKQNLEQEYSRMQKELRAQQKTLRQRSRRFSVNEEDSREDLRALTEEIQRLKQQLDLLDNQKIEEHVQLSNTIEELSKKEQHLQQEVQKISYQKEIAEEELEHTAQHFHKMTDAHEHEKQQHEKEIERLQRKQAHMEIRIAHLLDEQQRNERSLQQEIESLKHSKAILEEKVEQLRRENPDHDEEAERELLQVIERQESVIQQLKERAHQRSSMLRAENETLKQEVQSMLSEHEKINWENQMLESSLKTLQHDLAEYLLIKNKFEEAQREKEHFEEAFYRKIKFLEERYVASGETAPEIPEESVHIHHHVAETAPPAERTRNAVKTRKKSPKRQRRVPVDEEKTEKILYRSHNALWPKILIPVGAILILLLSALITVQLLKLFGPAEIPTTATELPPSGYALPEDKFGLHQPSNGGLLRNGADAVVPDLEPSVSPSLVEPEENSHMQPEPAVSPQHMLANAVSEQAESLPGEEPKAVPPNYVKQPQQVASTVVVQLTNGGNSRFLPREFQAFPTAENNVVLRRYYKRTRSDE
jgi:chromosome segregation ATPase